MRAEKSFLCQPFATHSNVSQPEINYEEAQRVCEESNENCRRWVQFEVRISYKIPCKMSL